MDDDHPLLIRAAAAETGLRSVDGMLPRRHRDVGHALIREAIATLQALTDALSEADGPAD